MTPEVARAAAVHAPVILPAVLCVALSCRPVFYLPLAVLHASVLAPHLGEDALAARRSVSAA